MNELKISTNLTISLNEITNYRLIEIGKIKDFFDQEIKDQELLIKKLSKYIMGFDCTDKILTVFPLVFCLGSGIIKKVLHKTKIRKKKHNKLLYLAKNKLDCVEILVSQAIIDQIISHDEFKVIMNEKKTMTFKKIQYIKVTEIV